MSEHNPNNKECWYEPGHCCGKSDELCTCPPPQTDHIGKGNKMVEAQARYYRENKDLYLEKQRDRRNKNRKHIKEVKEGSVCVDCKIKYPHYVLQFDHLKDKVMGVSKMASNHTLEQVISEIAKCEIVCANCHSHRTWVRSKTKTANY